MNTIKKRLQSQAPAEIFVHFYLNTDKEVKISKKKMHSQIFLSTFSGFY